MGVFGRLGNVIRANLNDLISRAEDPEKMLNQIVMDLREHLTDAKKQVAVAIADEKRLKKQADQQKLTAQEWERKAMMALRAGDEDLAREALSRKTEADKLASEYLKTWEQQKAQCDKLRDLLRQLNAKIDEASRKKNLLIAKQKRAEAQKMISATMQGLTDTSAFETFSRMEAKVDQMEAEADAAVELSLNTADAGLDERFKQLEGQSIEVDDQLAALKVKMGIAQPSAAALPGAQKAQKVELPQTQPAPAQKK